MMIICIFIIQSNDIHTYKIFLDCTYVCIQSRVGHIWDEMFSPLGNQWEKMQKRATLVLPNQVFLSHRGLETYEKGAFQK